MIPSAIRSVELGHDLSMETMARLIGVVMDGQCPEDDVARLLLALHRKGETVSEIAGAASAMRRHATPIRTQRRGLLDTCGTGGDGARTFNISTAAALVAAAAGVPVAKHGNRAVTSRSGSADVLAALGVNIEANLACVERCLDELGICFCFAPLLHQAMRHVAPVRKRLGVPTIFNILGPLANPANAEYQLLGVGDDRLRSLLAQSLALLGTTRAVIVHGTDGLDEVTLNGETQATEATRQGLQEWTWRPADFGVEANDLSSLIIQNAEESASLIHGVLSGRHGPARDIVVANAAAAIWTTNRAETPLHAAGLAAEAIDSGATLRILAKLVKLTNA
jgi:anthranilate phosphoribosyltransferase